MINYSNSKVIDKPIEQVASVILNVNDYPKFIPWCNGARILSQNKDEIEAELLVSYNNIQSSYTSKTKISTKNKQSIIIETTMIEGQFKYINSCWNLECVSPNSTNVVFNIEISFK